MNRRRRALLLAGLGVLVILAAVAANTLRNGAGITVGRDDTPAERRAVLAPFWRIVPADTDIASARAVLLSGCDGVHDNMDYWAGVLADAGRPALILDSHTPRSLDGLEAWRLVCAGQMLTGAERAGDLAVALAATGSDRVTLLGASHGGWAAMEFLRQLATGEPPPGLSAWPASPLSLASRIDGVVLLYPYCGLLNRSVAGDWSQLPPILLIAAEHDRIVSTPDCLATAEALRARGADIRVSVIPDADHGFDQAERSPLSALQFDRAARDAALREVRRFIAR
ncbi:dienelactone hydrolase family protein [Paracoccus sphaerophysae]|uniref:dienelactone hydrolase family protein n=1 Tax=Paracoccus sphaerophysae TaxID=690417 RepID=UPI002355164F|nr:dienelactone hydrolase family protein [Paracoccus sphaerophysae]